MRKGILFGCFDPLHHGHETLFSRCKNLCDHLTVCLHTDDYIRTWKHREPHHGQGARRAAVARCEDVDDAFLGGQRDRAAWAHDLDVSVVFLSEEIAPNRLGIPDEFEVIHMPRTPGISSTAMRSG